MSTHQYNEPGQNLSQGDLYVRMVAFGFGRARALRAVAFRRVVQAGLHLVAQSLLSCGDTLWTWQNRYNARRHMASLDARLLEDVGLTRADIARARKKPLWRA